MHVTRTVQLILDLIIVVIALSEEYKLCVVVFEGMESRNISR
jgi:hypothetical protein